MSNYTKRGAMLVLVISLCVSSTSVGAQEDPAQQQQDPARQYEGQTPDATLELDEIQIGYLVMGTMAEETFPQRRIIALAVGILARTAQQGAMSRAV